MSEQNLNQVFLDLEIERSDPKVSSVVVLPVPFERTTSYGKGAAAGPLAILEASQQVELYDEELHSEPYHIGIATLPPLADNGQSTETYLEDLARQIRGHIQNGKFVVCLGGEHTLTLAPIRAAQAVHGDLGVVQFDAHADLRNVYAGSEWSHACVMRRVHETGIQCLGVGIRSLSQEEALFIRERELEVIWGKELTGLSMDRYRRALAKLPTKVYLTFDVDFLDPSLVPATGTPEPGGGQWWPTLELLRVLFEEKEVVGMDLVELAPTAGLTSSDFVVARLAYKCIAYLHEARTRQT